MPFASIGRTRGTVVVQLSIALAGEVAAQAPREAEAADDASAPIAIVGVDIIPMAGDAPVLRDRTVVVRGDRIVEVGPRAEVAVPSGATRIDADGQFLIPGLADMHVHLEYFDDPAVLGVFLANGVTTVRNMDGRPYVLEWRERARSGELLGPTIVTAGPIIDGDPPLRDDNLSVGGPVEARAAVAEQARRGYDFVKVYTNLSPESYRAVVAEANARGLPVAGHVPRELSPADAFAAGQASLEHLDGYDALIEADDSPYRGEWHWSKLYLGMPADTAKIRAAARRTAAAGVWNVPTLVQKEKIAPLAEMRAWLESPEVAYVPADVREHWDPANWDPYSRRMVESFGAEERRVLERGERNARRLVAALREAGAGLLVGTDTPNPFVVPGFSVHEELENFVEAGLTPAEALAAATRAAAVFLGDAAEAGTIEVGRRADLVLLDADPLDDIRNTRSIRAVFVRGRRLDRRALDALLAAARSAARRPDGRTSGGTAGLRRRGLRHPPWCHGADHSPRPASHPGDPVACATVATGRNEPQTWRYTGARSRGDHASDAGHAGRDDGDRCGPRTRDA